MPITLPINLNSALVSKDENDKGLVSIDTGGLFPTLSISSGEYYSGFGSGPQLSYTPFDTQHVRDQIKTFEGAEPETLTTAMFSNIHLVQGQQLTIEYDYDFGDDNANDFAFALLGSSAADSSPALLADGIIAMAKDTTSPAGALHYHDRLTYNVNTTGDYYLVLGSADAIDSRQRSKLVVDSITVTTADKDFRVTPLGLKLNDGTTYLANGDIGRPNGSSTPSLFAPGSQALVSYLISQDGGGLISQDGGGVISNDGGSLISQDGGSLISQDGGSFTPAPGSTLASIISHEGGGLIGQDGGGLVASGAGNLIASGGGNLVASGAGNFQPSFRAFTDVGAQGIDLAFSSMHVDKKSAQAGGTVSIAYQVTNKGTADSGVSTTKFYLSTDSTVTTSDTLLGSDPEPSLQAGNAVSDSFDVVIPAGLASGTYYIAAISDANGQVTETDETNNVSDVMSIYVGKPPTPSGVPFTPAKLGGEFTIGTTGLDNRFAFPLANGNFAEVYSDFNNGLTLQIVGPSGSIVDGAVSPQTSSQHIQATELSDGRIAVVFQTGSGGIDGIIYNQNGSVAVPIFTVKAQAGYTWNPDSIAALSDGRFVVVENTYQNNFTEIRTGLAQVINGDGTTSVDSFAIAPSNSVPFAGVGVSQLADGRVLFEFTEKSGHNDYGVFFNSTFTQSTQVTLATNATDSGAFHAAPVVLDDGDFVSLYEAVIPGANGQPDTYLGLHAHLFHVDGTPFGGEIDLPGSPTLGQHNAKVVAVDTGGFVVTYEGNDDFSSGGYFGDPTVDVQRYNDDGTANGNLVVIPETSSRGSPSATILKDGHLVVTYAHGSGSVGDVGQIFNLGTYIPADPGLPSSDLTAALPTGGTAPAIQTGAHEVTYTDSSGHTVVDTSDTGNRIIKEVISSSAGVLATITFSYNPDGTYQTHGDFLTADNGTLAVDAAYGAKGAVSDVLHDSNGNVTATVGIAYNEDGSIIRHTTIAGVAGYSDEKIKGGIATPLVSITALTAAGIDLRWATLYNELANSPIGAGGTATQYTSVDSGQFNGQGAAIKFIVTGAGFTYSGSFPNIQLAGGTINTVQEQDSSGNLLATFAGLSISATTFQSAMNTYTSGGSANPSGLNAIFQALSYQTTGGAGSDKLQGHNLDDTIIGSTGNDTVGGGAGSNTVDYSSLTTPGLVALIQGGHGTVNKGGANGTDTVTNGQILVDTGTGRTNGDLFYVDANEFVTGSSSNFNYLIELSANVNLAYGTNFAGIAEFVSNVGTNTIDFSGDPNFAYLYGSTGDDTLTLGTGGGYMFGEGGTNTLKGGANATNLFVGGGGGTNTMNGGTGTAANYYFVGGNDQVNGAGAFNAVVELVSGVTVQLGSPQYQHVQEFVSNGGTNAVTVANTDPDFIFLYGGTGNDTLSTGSGGGYLIGEGGTNVLSGGGGLNVFVADGGSGVDTMNGGSGSNVYLIDANSIVHGAGTFNTVEELQQSASLVLGSAQLGSDVQQVVFNSGTNSADFHTATSSVYLYGGVGADTLFGGTGNDFLYGGLGANTFKFAAGWGQDTIMDWTAGSNDQIDLTALSSQGVHAISDLTQTISNGNDVITSSHTGTNSITLLGAGSALTASSFHFA